MASAADHESPDTIDSSGPRLGETVPRLGETVPRIGETVPWEPFLSNRSRSK
jgi:hypothetical protein